MQMKTIYCAIFIMFLTTWGCSSSKEAQLPIKQTKVEHQDKDEAKSEETINKELEPSPQGVPQNQVSVNKQKESGESASGDSASDQKKGNEKDSTAQDADTLEKNTTNEVLISEYKMEALEASYLLLELNFNNSNKKYSNKLDPYIKRFTKIANLIDSKEVFQKINTSFSLFFSLYELMTDAQKPTTSESDLKKELQVAIPAGPFHQYVIFEKLHRHHKTITDPKIFIALISPLISSQDNYWHQIHIFPFLAQLFLKLSPTDIQKHTNKMNEVFTKSIKLLTHALTLTSEKFQDSALFTLIVLAIKGPDALKQNLSTELQKLVKDKSISVIYLNNTIEHMFVFGRSVNFSDLTFIQTIYDHLKVQNEDTVLKYLNYFRKSTRWMAFDEKYFDLAFTLLKSKILTARLQAAEYLTRGVWTFPEQYENTPKGKYYNGWYLESNYLKNTTATFIKKVADLGIEPTDETYLYTLAAFGQDISKTKSSHDLFSTLIESTDLKIVELGALLVTYRLLHESFEKSGSLKEALYLIKLTSKAATKLGKSAERFQKGFLISFAPYLNSKTFNNLKGESIKDADILLTVLTQLITSFKKLDKRSGDFFWENRFMPDRWRQSDNAALQKFIAASPNLVKLHEASLRLYLEPAEGSLEEIARRQDGLARWIQNLEFFSNRPYSNINLETHESRNQVIKEIKKKYNSPELSKDEQTQLKQGLIIYLSKSGHQEESIDLIRPYFESKDPEAIRIGVRLTGRIFERNSYELKISEYFFPLINMVELKWKNISLWCQCDLKSDKGITIETEFLKTIAIFWNSFSSFRPDGKIFKLFWENHVPFVFTKLENNTNLEYQTLAFRLFSTLDWTWKIIDNSTLPKDRLLTPDENKRLKFICTHLEETSHPFREKQIPFSKVGEAHLNVFVSLNALRKTPNPSVEVQKTLVAQFTKFIDQHIENFRVSWEANLPKEILAIYLELIHHITDSETVEKMVTWVLTKFKDDEATTKWALDKIISKPWNKEYPLLKTIIEKVSSTYTKDILFEAYKNNFPTIESKYKIHIRYFKPFYFYAKPLEDRKAYFKFALNATLETEDLITRYQWGVMSYIREFALNGFGNPDSEENDVISGYHYAVDTFSALVDQFLIFNKKDNTYRIPLQKEGELSRFIVFDILEELTRMFHKNSVKELELSQDIYQKIITILQKVKSIFTNNPWATTKKMRFITQVAIITEGATEENKPLCWPLFHSLFTVSFLHPGADLDKRLFELGSPLFSQPSIHTTFFVNEVIKAYTHYFEQNSYSFKIEKFVAFKNIGFVKNENVYHVNEIDDKSVDSQISIEELISDTLNASNKLDPELVDTSKKIKLEKWHIKKTAVSQYIKSMLIGNYADFSKSLFLTYAKQLDKEKPLMAIMDSWALIQDSKEIQSYYDELTWQFETTSAIIDLYLTFVEHKTTKEKGRSGLLNFLKTYAIEMPREDDTQELGVLKPMVSKIIKTIQLTQPEIDELKIINKNLSVNGGLSNRKINQREFLDYFLKEATKE